MLTLLLHTSPRFDSVRVTRWLSVKVLEQSGSVHYSGMEWEGRTALRDGGIDISLDISLENCTDSQGSCLLGCQSWNEADMKILGVYIALLSIISIYFLMGLILASILAWKMYDHKIWPHHINMTTSYWSDHIISIWSQQYAKAVSLLRSNGKCHNHLPIHSFIPCDMIEFVKLIWLDWYDDINCYKLSNFVALTSVMNDCSERKHVYELFGHIDMIILISYQYNQIITI